MAEAGLENTFRGGGTCDDLGGGGGGGQNKMGNLGLWIHS